MRNHEDSVAGRVTQRIQIEEIDKAATTVTEQFLQFY